MASVDDLTLEVSSGATGDAYVVEPGKYAMELVSVELEQGKPDAFNAGKFYDELKFGFKTLKPLNDPEDENDGKHGVISHWVRVTRYDPNEGTRSKLTLFLDQLFGRKMTAEEARALALGKLVGIKGWVVVGAKASGKGDFNSFVHDKRVPPPSPANFAKDASPANRPTPKQVVTDRAIGEIDDPFEDDSPENVAATTKNGKGKDAPF